MDYIAVILVCLAIALLGFWYAFSGAPRDPYWRRGWLYRLEREQAKRHKLRALKHGKTQIPAAGEPPKSKRD